MEICPRCTETEDITRTVTDDGIVMLRCTNPKHDPYRWAEYVEPQGKPGRTGRGQRLGVYDDLLAVFEPGAPITEHGVIEHRYAGRNPAAYRELVDHYGHTSLGPAGYSASAFLGRALAQLWQEGALEFRWVEATGRWAYNGQTGGYALPGYGAKDDPTVLHWDQFATDAGIDPSAWPAIR